MPEQTAIYGAGELGGIFLEGLREARQVDFFIDQYSPKPHHMGLPVRRLEDVDDPAEVRLYVAVVSRQSKRDDPEAGLESQLRARGFDVVPFEESITSLPNAFRDYARREHLWWRTNPEEMVDAEEVDWLRDRLEDEQSKDVLDRIVRFRRTLEPADYVSPDDEVEYFPDNVPVFDGIDSLRFCDCGAYIGDTLDDLEGVWQRDMDFAVSFEPDGENLQVLRETAQRLSRSRPGSDFIVVPGGVWSGDAIVSFSSGNTSSSSIGDHDSAGALVPVFSLDSMLASAAPNFIKMDIEGAEQEALQGASGIISRFRPTLAICVYHKPRDLWEIPRMVLSMQPDYRLYLRVHNHLGLSTVLYCCPNQR